MDIVGLFPQFGGFALTLLAFILALSIIVAVHEYGHYIVGRWSGIHADVFSIGFGPVLFSRVDKRGTRWQIAALPFGGFVKFAGDANAASGKDSEAMAEVEHDPVALRRTMHGAPLWARSATVAAGPVFNFVMSILVFAGMIFLQGEPKEPLTVGELLSLPDGTYDLQVGDEIVGIEGMRAPPFGDETGWSEFRDGMPTQAVFDYTVLRNGAEFVVPGPVLMPPYVQQVAPRSAADDIDLKPGDVITSIDGEPIVAFEQIRDAVEGSDGRVLLLDVWRSGEQLEFALAPKRVDEPQDEGGFKTEWRIGIIGGMAFEPATQATGLAQSLWGGVVQTGNIITGSLSGLYHMITGAISTCNMSGVIGIAETSGSMASQGADNFIWFIAVLSVAVGLLNLFPIPALDGGHLVFYAYEAVTGKPPSDRALQVMMATGLALILTLMIFAIGNDIFCP